MLAQAAEASPLVLDTFAEASDALGYDLWSLVSQGPDEQLTLTEFTQPAILTASVAPIDVGCTAEAASLILLLVTV